jgi:thiol-disulfide isomerase/thioredoxin
MAKGINPATVTVLLSAAAAVGYLSYRLLVPESGTAPANEPPTPGEARLAERLPDFALPDLDGSPLSIASWPDTPLLINFWATWCAPCLREIPLLKDFQAEHPDVQVVGIAVDSADPVQRFAREMQFNYPIMVGEADAISAAAAFGVDVLALPFTVFTAGDGRVLAVRTGEVHAEHLQNLTAVLADLGARRIDVDTARRRLAGLM